MRSILSEATQHINNIIEGKGIRTLSEWKLLVTCYDNKDMLFRIIEELK